MNKTIAVITLILAFIAGFFLFYRGKPVSAPTQENTPVSTSTSAQKWDPQTNEQDAVTVTVTPIDLGVDSKEWKFDVVMNTHSVELDQDMVKATILIDNPGEEYKPVRWEGAGPGGHHREGVLVFAPIKPYPQHLNLIIKGIGGIDRPFAWILNGE